MRYVTYGEGQQPASEVVLGTMRIWEKNPDEVADLIEGALDVGVNAVDTAPIYGPSEGLIGSALALRKGLRDRIWLQTKLGIRHHPSVDANYFDSSYAHIIESVEASLAALQTDHVDSLLIHRPDALMEPAEVARAFRELKDAGKVLSFGVSNMAPSTMRLLEGALDVRIEAAQVQLSCAFTPMLDAYFNANMQNDAGVMRDGGILEHCQAKDMVVQAWSVLQHGYFGGVFLVDDNYAELNATLARIGEEHGVSAGAAAVAWVLRLPARTQALVGTTKVSRVAELARACDFELSREEWYEIYLAAGNRLP